MSTTQPTPAPTPELPWFWAETMELPCGDGPCKTLKCVSLEDAQAALAAKDAEIAMANDAAAKGTKARDIADALTQQLAAKDREIAELKDKVVSAAWEYGKQKTRAEKAEAELDALRTLWTEARVVVAQCRDANCLASYGKAQCDAVAAANAWLDKMPATVKRTIDDASNTEWQLQRVIAERDHLRAEVERLKRRDSFDLQAINKIVADQTANLRAALAAAQQDKERLDWLSTRFPDDDAGDCDPEGIERKWMSVWENSFEGSSLRAAIDATRSREPDTAS